MQTFTDDSVVKAIPVPLNLCSEELVSKFAF
jgi:hypothetical protein